MIDVNKYSNAMPLIISIDLQNKNKLNSNRFLTKINQMIN